MSSMRDMPLPKYHQIYLILREHLAEGRFTGGLPGELNLVEEFKVARVTIRKALELLAAEGLISREPGRRTRAIPARPSDNANRATGNLSGLLENLVTTSLTNSLKVLQSTTLPASAAACEALQLEPGAIVHKVVRLRSIKEGPLSYITTFVPADIVPKFTRRQLTSKPMLLLLEDAGVRVGGAHQTVTARLADAETSEHLEVAVGSALLAVRRLVYNEAKRPVQWLHGFYRPDRYAYEMTLSRVGSADTRIWVNK